ncbi:MAG: hypothetical protein ACJAWN_002662 [Neolewinella sp.]|jgi:hypothetical protein
MGERLYLEKCTGERLYLEKCTGEGLYLEEYDINSSLPLGPPRGTASPP